MIASPARSTRLSLRTVVALSAVALLTSMSACKDDKKPEEAAAGAEGAAAGAEAKAGEAGEAGEAAKAAAPAAASRTGVAMGDKVLTIGGVPSLKKVLAAATDLGRKLAPDDMPPDLSSIAMEGIKEMLGVTDISWLATEKPIKVFTLDPKSFEGKGQGLVLPISDKAKVMASLKPEAKKDDGGHAASFEHQFQTWYVDFIDGHVVLTDHAKSFETAKGLVTGALMGWTPERLISAQVNLKAVNAVFGPEIEGAKATAKEVMAQSQGGPGMPDMTKVLDKEVDMLFDLLASTERADFDLWVDGSDAKMSLAFAGISDSPVARFAKTIEGKSSSLLKAAAPNTWMGFSANMDVREFKGMRDLQMLSIESYARLLEVPDARINALRGVLEKITDSSTGDAVTTFYTDGTFPLAFTSVAKLADAEAVRKLYVEFYEGFREEGIAKFKKGAKDAGVAAPGLDDIEDLTGLVAAANKMAGPMGVNLTITDEDKDGAHIYALTATADWNKLGIKEADPDAFAMLDGIVGKTVSIAFVFQGDAVSTAFGPKAIETARRLANGEFPGGDEHLSAASNGRAMAMTLLLDRLLSNLTFIPELAPLKSKVDSLPKDRPLTFTMSGAGSTVITEFSVPTDVVKAISEMGF